MKRVNVNFILAMAVVVVLFMTSLSVWNTVRKADKELEQIENSIEEKHQEGEIGDVEGHGMILESFAYLIGGMGVILIKTILMIMVGYALLLFVVALTARLVYKDFGGRLLAYRMIMGIEYALQAILEVVLIISITRLPTISNVLVAVLLGAEIIYSARNTYTPRICMTENDKN
ncbi:MAG: hypothetical protein IJA10_04610 [Lachnospiraceae bacterium]|nr:hypothetical protein [Lachnospiraceae bacterium]